MTDTTDTSPDADQHSGGRAGKKSGGLNSMLLADLRSMAGGLGISGTGSMKKADLVAAIKQAQSGSSTGPDRRSDAAAGGKADRGKADGGKADGGKADGGKADGGRQEDRKQPAQQDQAKQGGGEAERQPAQSGPADQAGEGEGGRRNRRRRGRDRAANRVQGGPTGRNEPDTTVFEDDVLVPAAGILDVLDNYAFVRTSGYLPGPDDVYLSLSLVRKYGLRRGDALVGQVRQPREGERKEKFNPMVRVDSVNGAEPDQARTRPEFESLTAVHPTTRLRFETEPGGTTGRTIDLVAPIGKGQRGLIVAPPRSGKTTLLRNIAAALTQNNPECHLMVVLVDERPEEVTEFTRTIKGEVIASTLDRPPVDHTVLAELAIERAKRLVEAGHDVVLLVDGLTRLGRAYNLAASSGGRSLPSGLDTTALHPPKRFFGAARSLEGAGSLTILATAHVGSGSPIDEALLEDFVDAANAEIRLCPAPEDPKLFPAIDIAASGTRHEEHLVSEQEQALLRKLRRAVAGPGTDPLAASAALHERLRGASTNIELLRRT